jgi:hypothetical protein
MPDTYTFDMFEGVDVSVDFTMVDSDGVAINISGGSVACKFRKEYEDATALITAVGSIVTPASGIYRITVPAATTLSAASSVVWPAAATNYTGRERSVESSYVPLFYDIIVTLSGIKYMTVRGIAKFYRSATR